MIHKELIYINLQAKKKEDVIEKLADELFSAGKVKETFKEAVLAREKEYPTGLPLGNYNIAMPHTFAQHVVEPAIAVAKLETPVIFTEMGTTDTELPVSLIMMMAVSEPKEQVGLLKKILQVFSDNEVLQELMESTTVQDMYETLKYIDE
mgnify:CR=1 FL=1